MANAMTTEPEQTIFDYFDPKEKNEVFTHKDDDGTFRTFIITAMNRFAAKHGGKCDQVQLVQLSIDPEHVEHVKSRMGIEPERLERMIAPYLYVPPIAIEWPSPHRQRIITLVDGNHRLCKLYESGVKIYGCYIFTYPFWENFLLPESLGEPALTKPSGMLEIELTKKYDYKNRGKMQD